MSNRNSMKIVKSCSEGEILEREETRLISNASEFGNRLSDENLLRSTFSLPRNPFSTRSSKRRGKLKAPAEGMSEPRDKAKVFRRPSWRKFIERVIQHVSRDKATCSYEYARRGWVGGLQGCWQGGGVPGAVGLRNHGNTCFMNAVLQCLAHTDILAEYFVLNQYKLDLRRRKRQGSRGELTEQLALLLKAMWTGLYEPDMSSQFKAAVDKHGSQYRGGQQHDAQEFLLWLLDKVHEELNTASKSKYKVVKNTFGRPDEVVAAETLANHVRCNNSFVHTVFQAQFRSSLTCPRCHRQSNTFDPFLCMSVPVPQTQHRPLYVTVLYTAQQPRQVKLGVWLPAQAVVRELRHALAQDTGISPAHMLLTEVDDLGFQRTFSDTQLVASVREQDPLFCLELPQLKDVSEDLGAYVLLCTRRNTSVTVADTQLVASVREQDPLFCLELPQLKDVSEDSGAYVLLCTRRNTSVTVADTQLVASVREQDPLFCLELPQLKDVSEDLGAYVLLCTRRNTSVTVADTQLVASVREQDPLFCLELPQLKDVSEDSGAYVLLCTRRNTSVTVADTQLVASVREQDPLFCLELPQLKDVSEDLGAYVLLCTRRNTSVTVADTQLVASVREQDPLFCLELPQLKDVSEDSGAYVLLCTRRNTSVTVADTQLVASVREQDPLFCLELPQLKDVSEDLGAYVLLCMRRNTSVTVADTQLVASVREQDPLFCLELPQLKDVSEDLGAYVLLCTRRNTSVTVADTQLVASVREQDPLFCLELPQLKDVSEDLGAYVLLCTRRNTSVTVADTQLVASVREQDPLFCLELPQLKDVSEDSGAYVLLCWANILVLEDHQARFGCPYTMQLCRETSYQDLQKLILKEMSSILHDDVLVNAQAVPLFRIRVLDGLGAADTYLDPSLDLPLYTEAVEQALALCEDSAGPQHVKLHLEWDLRAKESTVADDSDPIEEHTSVKQLQTNSEQGGAVTLEECFELYTKAEVLEADDAWHCPSCNRKQEVVKKLGLWSLPDILVIHLKRFRQSKQRASSKLTTLVDFSLSGVDMSPHLASKLGTQGTVRWSPWKRPCRTPARCDDNVYDLYAVCNHHGQDLQGGHYTAYCRNPYDGRWYCFDDTRVERMAECEVVTQGAYLLFYQRRGLAAGDWGSQPGSRSHEELRVTPADEKKQFPRGRPAYSTLQPAKRSVATETDAAELDRHSDDETASSGHWDPAVPADASPVMESRV
ncbi:ubiquitin carboxyl-terminal hydrolase 31 isoform X2 [Bacillus rossius redtenbacheri]|uniref:ubiquitin carboxyl-terminal hydrolase 31 isoform X2 n=1 Tax=Bacillus rossius redtenbacheri TaxID=93214 RepID=UPI002FDE0E82